FTVTNTGNVTITNITIDDPLVAVVGGPIDLAPGASDSTTFTATYAITQADIDAGGVFNLATATGQDPNGDDVTDDSEDPTPVDPADVDPNCPECTVTILDQTPSIALIKTGTFNDLNGDGFAQAGETITYAFTVTNTGNVTITNIVITDPLVTVVGGSIDLAPGESDSTTFTAVYTITQTDVNNGFVENQALATGQDPNGNDTTDTSDDDSELEDDITVTDLPQMGMITLIKRGTFNDENGDGIAQVGETITYIFTVFNTGNVTVTNIVITDPLVDVQGGPIDLAPNQGNSTEFFAIYPVTQADIDAGFVENQALAVGQDPDGNDVSDLSDEENALEDDPTITDLPTGASIALIKVGTFADENGDGLAQAGETINYTFTVTNTGNTTVTNIVITDPLVTVVGGPIDLAPGQTDSTTFTATYTITQEDVDTGFVNNQATATGQDTNGNDVSDLSDDDSNFEDDITVTDLPDDVATIGLIKVGTFNDLNGDGFAQVGETITYAFTVTNTGNFTITNIVITDPLVAVDGGPIDLEPGEVDSTTFTATYVLTQEDVDAGGVMNQATATGQDPDGNDISDTSDDDSNFEDDTTITDLPSQISLSLEKSGEWVDLNGDGFAQVGELINYTFTVYNTGEATLSNILVTDPLVTVDGGPITLGLGESDDTTFTAVYILTEEDIAQNLVVNQAVVTGTDGVNTTQDLSDDPNDPTDFDENNDGEPDDPTITIFEGVLNVEDITVFNGISADDDGINDILIFEGIENFPDNNVQIFNRWGVQVYERDGYKNDSRAFNGTSEGRFTISENKKLPVGTYYYIVNYLTADGPRQKVGYLYINK
ncbi:MAG: gliding motility-associated C-terminal domain-containing protein, partial [Dokdonia sp.]